MDLKLKGKVVLILGGTGGIGSAITAEFQKEGASVCAHGRSGNYATDLTSEDAMAGLVEKAMKQFGRVDTVINSLSTPVKHGALESKKWSDFQDQIDVQTRSFVDLLPLVVPTMKRQGGGRIINILTTYVIGQPPSGLADYVTAKYALLGLTKAAARELGKYHITVNAVSPSFIRNKFTDRIPEKFDELLISQTPLGRLATPEDVARTVLFLASEKAEFITGENIIVAGGQTMD
ncbi:MAG: SDR family oxidoreductase [Candidatus Harrisonbacteria bacterium]|nr:SDR family oxidoreductase [Candidatus Harrisonbacteria bacterium]